MPSPAFVRELFEESQKWVMEDLVTVEQAEAIRAKYPAPAPAGENAITQVLYATAGILLGAAAIALVVVGFEIEEAFAIFLAGLAMLGAGSILSAAFPSKRLLADALLVGSLVPISVSTFPDGGEATAWLAVLIPAAMLVWRRERAFVQSLSVIAFSVASAGAVNQYLTDGEWVAWMVVQIVLLAGVVTLDRTLRKEDNLLATALAVGAVGIAFTVYLAGELELPSTGVQLVLGLLMLVVMGTGVTLRHRGVVVGAGAVLAIDAIVFAFDFGGVFTGTLVLVAIAALLIVQAEALKRYLASTAA